MRTAQLHGRELAYREAGAGEGKPTLLLVHGMAGSSETWREMIPRLEGRFHVLAPDLPGHGASSLDFDDYSLGAMASALRDLLVVKGITRCTIVGQSLGGGVAMQFVYQYPDFCERIVLIGSGGLGREVNAILRLLALPGAELLLGAGAAPFLVDAGNAVGRFFRSKGIRAAAIGESWAAYEMLSRSGHRRTFFKTLRAVVDGKGQAVSAANRLHLAGRLPFQLIWGDRDPIIPVSHGHDTHEAIPGSRLAVIEGAGHYPHVEDPAAVERVLVEFMESTEPGRIDPETLVELVTGEAAGTVENAAGSGGN